MKRSFVPILLLLVGIAAAQRLPEDVVPVHYQITLAPDLKNATFRGDEGIDVRLLKPASEVVLNSAEIMFGEVSVTAAGSTQSAKVTTDDKAETATLTLPSALSAGPAVIHIKFTGTLNDKLRGFYLSKTKRRNYAATQFEATDARRAFPCFDEPAMKATFDVSVVADNGDTAISNAKILSDTPGPGEGKHTIKFGTSPKMSSYLVALAVGDFQCLEGGADGIPIRVCAVPEKKEMGHFALESAEQILKFYDRYYGIKYPFGKLDLVGLPDFAAGAMENTAAIFYRETALLIDDKTASVEAHKGVAGANAHEMAHMWFGDLVTMNWWDDVWLNEGFATWMSAKPIAAWKPGWNTAVDEVQGTSGSLTGDSMKATRAIHATANEASTPEQIGQLFDGIAYGKTAAVLRMIESWLGEETFRKGVNAYLQQHAYGNARAADFWNVMATVSGKPVDKMMPTWVEQPGAPLLSVKAQCRGVQTVLQLSQRRFFDDPAAMQASNSELWELPVCIKAPGAKSPTCELMTQKEQAFKLRGCAPWLFVNAGAHGYYRTEYSPEMIAKLAPNAEQALTPGERIMLIGDEWAMARSGRHSIGDYLNLVQGLGAERTRQVVQSFSGPLAYIASRLASDQDKEAYRAWLRGLFRPLYNQLGWDPKPGETDETRSLRAAVLSILGYPARDPEVMREATAVARRYLQDPASVDPNVAGLAMSLAAYQGDAQLYDEYLAHAKSANSPEEHYRYMGALSAFREPALAERSLQAILSPDVRVQDMFGPLAGLLSNEDTQDLAWNFLKTHWDEVQKKSGGGLGGGFGFVASFFCTAEARQDVQQWFAQHPDPGGDRQLRQGLERLDDCVRMRKTQSENLSNWLKQHGSTAGQ